MDGGYMRGRIGPRLLVAFQEPPCLFRGASFTAGLFVLGGRNLGQRFLDHFSAWDLALIKPEYQIDALDRVRLRCSNSHGEEHQEKASDHCAERDRHGPHWNTAGDRALVFAHRE